jgi:hypothetical protein
MTANANHPETVTPAARGAPAHARPASRFNRRLRRPFAPDATLAGLHRIPASGDFPGTVSMPQVPARRTQSCDTPDLPNGHHNRQSYRRSTTDPLPTFFCPVEANAPPCPENPDHGPNCPN